jgi:hypothetical protein
MSASIIARLNALEAEVTELRAITESYKAKEKTAKVKKETTNAEGPAEWNVFLNTVWREMAADHGIVCEDAAEFKKEVKSHGKDSGFSYQEAMKEASRRKAALEGTVPKVKVAKVKESKDSKEPAKTELAELKARVAAAKAAKAAKAAAEAPAPKVAPKVAPAPKAATPKVETELDRQLAAAAEMGWSVVQHDGQTFFHDPSDDLAFSYPDGNDQIGMYSINEDGEGEFIPKDE